MGQSVHDSMARHARAPTARAASWLHLNSVVPQSVKSPLFPAHSHPLRVALPTAPLRIYSRILQKGRVATVPAAQQEAR